MAGGGGEGREGDWDCGSCRNRNYAFRSFCNRCKQPRLLVDTKDPTDSKWLPRIGDWICTGCSNNNYASREKCKKCGQPKEEAAMPAVAMPGASLPTYAHYFARAQGLFGLRINYGMASSSSLQQSLAQYSNWSYSGADKYGLESGSSWPFKRNSSGLPYGNNANQLTSIPKGWRSGDWICNCGFHNYSSRQECKKCNASVPTGAPSLTSSTSSDFFPSLGMKRLASEEFINDWDNKRLNAGDFNSHFSMNGPQHSYQDLEQLKRSNNQISGPYSQHTGGNSAITLGIQMRPQSSQQTMTPTLIGKGAKQWRDGDWMCTNCNNHNFASRSSCNRCKTKKEGAEPVDVS